MTLEEQGAYRNLLDEAHLRGGPLPNDDRILAKACGDATAWDRVRTVVMARFTLEPDGWHNDTLDEVYAKTMELSRERSHAGKIGGIRSGEARRQAKREANTEANTPSKTPSQTNSPSPSPSPSLVSGTVSESVSVADPKIRMVRDGGASTTNVRTSPSAKTPSAAAKNGNGRLQKASYTDAASPENLAAIKKLVHLAIQASPELDEVSLKEDVKQACARHHLPYHSQVVSNAVTMTLAMKRHAAK